jgi:hypothetical protein
MPAHWTYAPFEATADLEQGDILRPTDALQTVFSEVHPHFRDSKYLAFLVATQSCDLVLRGRTPKAAYINLSAVRPLSHVIEKILGEVAEPAGAGIFRTSAKSEAHRLLERVINQNEQAIGLFFLHEDSDAGIAETAIAFLRVTVALRSDRHYETLKAARVGRLTPEFRAKLGWLIGNLYSRPATPDWNDKLGGKKACDSLISQYISEARWIDDEIVERAKADGIDLALASPVSLEALRPPSKIEKALTELEEELKKIVPDFEPANLVKVKNRLRNSGKFIKLFK